MIEVAMANYFGYRQNVIVPNVFWGLGFKHELDLLVLTQSGYATEIEIKISKSDLKRDSKKRWGHNSNKIKKFYFAVPSELRDTALSVIPHNAGLFTVSDKGIVETIRAPWINKDAKPLSESDKEHLYKLAAMRIWSLKQHLIDMARA